MKYSWLALIALQGITAQFLDEPPEYFTDHSSFVVQQGGTHMKHDTQARAAPSTGHKKFKLNGLDSLDYQPDPGPQVYTRRGTYTKTGKMPYIRRLGGAIWYIIGPQVTAPIHSAAFNASIKLKVCAPQLGTTSLPPSMEAYQKAWLFERWPNITIVYYLSGVLEAATGTHELPDNQKCDMSLTYSLVIPELVERRQIRPLNEMFRHFADLTGIDPVLDMPPQCQYHVYMDGQYWGLPLFLQMLTERANATTFQRAKRFIQPPNNMALVNLNENQTRYDQWSRSLTAQQKKLAHTFETFTDDQNWWFFVMNKSEPHKSGVCMIAPYYTSFMMSRGIPLIDEKGVSGFEQPEFCRGGKRSPAHLIYEDLLGKHEQLMRKVGGQSSGARKYFQDRLAGKHWSSDDPFLMWVGTCPIPTAVEVTSSLYRPVPGLPTAPEIATVSSPDKIVQMNGWYWTVSSHIQDPTKIALVEDFLSWYINFRDNPKRRQLEMSRNSMPLFFNGRNHPEILQWATSRRQLDLLKWYPFTNQQNYNNWNQRIYTVAPGTQVFDFNNDELARARPPGYPTRARAGDGFVELNNIIPVYLIELAFFSGLQNLQDFDILNWNLLPEQPFLKLPARRHDRKQVEVNMTQAEREDRFCQAGKVAGDVLRYTFLRLCTPGRDLQQCNDPASLLRAKDDPGSLEAQLLAKDCQQESDLIWVKNKTCHGRSTVEYPVWDPQKINKNCKIDLWSEKLRIESVKWRVATCPNFCTPGRDLDICQSSRPSDPALGEIWDSECQKESDLIWRTSPCSSSFWRDTIEFASWNPAKLGVTCRETGWSLFAITYLTSIRQVPCPNICTPGRYLDVCSQAAASDWPDCELVGHIRWDLNRSCIDQREATTTMVPTWRSNVDCTMTEWSRFALEYNVTRPIVNCPSNCELGYEWNSTGCEIRLLRGDDVLEVTFGAASDSDVHSEVFAVDFVACFAIVLLSERAMSSFNSYAERIKTDHKKSEKWRNYRAWALGRAIVCWLSRWLLVLAIFSDFSAQSVRGTLAVGGVIEGGISLESFFASLGLGIIFVLLTRMLMIDSLDIIFVKKHISDIENNKVEAAALLGHSPNHSSRKMTATNIGISSLELETSKSHNSEELVEIKEEIKEEIRKMADAYKIEENPKKTTRGLLQAVTYRTIIMCILVAAYIPLTLLTVAETNFSATRIQISLHGGFLVLSLFIDSLLCLGSEMMLLLVPHNVRYAVTIVSPIISIVSVRTALSQAQFKYGDREETSEGLSHGEFSQLATFLSMGILSCALYIIWRSGDISRYRSQGIIKNLESDAIRHRDIINRQTEQLDLSRGMLIRSMLQLGDYSSIQLEQDLTRYVKHIYLSNWKLSESETLKKTKSSTINDYLNSPAKFLKLIEVTRNRHITDSLLFVAFYNFIFMQCSNNLWKEVCAFARLNFIEEDSPMRLNVSAPMRTKASKGLSENKRVALNEVYAEIVTVLNGGIETGQIKIIAAATDIFGNETPLRNHQKAKNAESLVITSTLPGQAEEN